jgi:3-oxochol-4-en-24-oyl-CoA dehydrogenase
MLGLTDEHRALAEAADAFAAARDQQGEARELLDGSAARLPSYWAELADLGWLGLNVPERLGGQGYSLLETAVVLERLAMHVAPGPLLPTLIAATVLAECGDKAVQAAHLPDLVDGSRLGAVVVRGSNGAADKPVHVYGGAAADLLLLPYGQHDLLLVNSDDVGIDITPAPQDLDLMRRSVIVEGAAELVGEESQIVRGGQVLARRVAWILAAVEAAGGAQGCLEMATSYAKQRAQFGRPIGTFQAVKHILANTLVEVELSVAAAWDAAGCAATGDEAMLAAAVGAEVALPAYLRAAERNIQVHGGIGYTWEHDAHLHLRRAAALRGFLGAEPAAADLIAGLTERGVRRSHVVDLPDEAERHRAEVRAFVAGVRDAGDDLRRRLVDSGYLIPHWPKPWGRAASPVEQIVIEQELAELGTFDLGITGWIALTLAQNASAEQVERWIRPTLLGNLTWCQLFSEPDAGSDAAAVRTRGVRVNGGWLVTGQKVWTSGARESGRGLATVRTDPAADKHAGITVMAIDMAARGVDIRPLRELTGSALFNEVFLDQVFVPDADVVGRPGDGWRLARATLGNERVTIGTRRRDGRSARLVLDLIARHAPEVHAWRREAAGLLAEEYALRSLSIRQVARAVSGASQGPEGNISKLAAGEHTQRTAELGMRVAGPAGVLGLEPALTELFLFSRCLTIAGGTSEILRNQIAERLLGLPRERWPRHEEMGLT